jgi:hypothetical protein
VLPNVVFPAADTPPELFPAVVVEPLPPLPAPTAVTIKYKGAITEENVSVASPVPEALVNVPEVCGAPLPFITTLVAEATVAKTVYVMPLFVYVAPTVAEPEVIMKV